MESYKKQLREYNEYQNFKKWYKKTPKKRDEYDAFEYWYKNIRSKVKIDIKRNMKPKQVRPRRTSKEIARLRKETIRIKLQEEKELYEDGIRRRELASILKKRKNKKKTASSTEDLLVAGKYKRPGILYNIIRNQVKKTKSVHFNHRSDELRYESSGAKFEIDIYVPSIKVGFEYQGQQHYRPVDYFGGEKQFIKQKQRDEEKRKICKELGIVLYTVPYRWDHKKIESTIARVLNKHK